MTISGDARKLSVLRLASLRPRKLLRLQRGTFRANAPVEAGDDRVFLALVLAPVPLADARAAGVGEHGAADLLELRGDAVARDGRRDELGAGRDHEGRRGLEAVRLRLTSNRRHAAHVLERRVGARADQCGADLVLPLVLLDEVLEAGEGRAEVGRVRAAATVRAAGVYRRT